MVANAAVLGRVRPRRESVAVGDRLPVMAVGLGIAALPLLQPKGPGNTAPVDVVLGGAILVVLMWSAAVNARIRLPYLIPVAIIVLAGAVSGLVGNSPNNAVVALWQDIFLLAWCAAIATVARTPAALRTLLSVWVWSAVAWAAILDVSATAGLRSIAGISGANGGRARLTFDHPNLAASYFAMSLFVVVLSGRPRSATWRVAAVLVLLMAVVLSGSNAALLGVGVGATIAIAVAAARRIDVIAGFAILATVGLLAIGLTPLLQHSGATQAIERSGNTYVRYSVGRGDRSYGLRLELFQEQLALFREGPVLGRGPASTRDVLTERRAARVKEAHNDYLAALVERGFIGAIGLIALIVAITMRLAAIGPRALTPEFARVAPRTTALIGAAAMLATSAAVHEVLHYRHLWALLGIVAALEIWGRHEPVIESGDAR